jgi:uncharacterized coiled-coil protein SlyX
MAKSQVIIALDEIATAIKTAHQEVAKARNTLDVANSKLQDLPNVYSERIAEINGYIPSGVDEEVYQAKLASLITEFTDLQTKITAAVAAIDA